MKVFILAGGLGTRIRSMFPDQPKPLIPIHGKPFLEWQIDLLKHQGFTEFILCLSYRADQIQEHFGDGARHGISVAYSIERSPLGTAGALKQAAARFDATSLVLNGDTYFAADFRALVEAHRQAGDQPIGTIGLVSARDVSAYGQVLLANDRRILEFHEKSADNHAPGLINAGAYMLEPAVIDFIPAGRQVSIEHDTFPAILASGKILRGITLEGTFVDMGTPEGYSRLEQMLR